MSHVVGCNNARIPNETTIMIPSQDHAAPAHILRSRHFAWLFALLSSPILKADEPPVLFESICDMNMVVAHIDHFVPQRNPTLFHWSGQSSVPDAPDPPMATDRPDVTEASSTVGSGVLQIETGYTYLEDRTADQLNQSHSFPEVLLRYGTPADWLELRFATNISHQKAETTSFTGTEDLYFGAKLGLTLQEGLYPEMALVPQMTIPSGSGTLTAGKLLPGVNWLYGWDINDAVSTAGSTQFNFSVDEESGKDYTEWTQTWTVGFALHDQVGAYTEWFAFIPHASDSARTEHYANCGLTFQATDDIQWDIRTGMGLNDAAADWFSGIGLSFRFR